MQTLTETLIDSALSDRIFTDKQLSRLLDGSSQRRYNLVNRALRAGELIRLRRGLYLLPDKYRSKPCHPFSLAQALAPSSYVSLETALAYHGWIPEAVFTTASIVAGRKAKNYHHQQMGAFTFYPLAMHHQYFLEMVERLCPDGQAFLLAKPMRALMDLICLKKVEWQGLSWLEKNMRIDIDVLLSVPAEELQILQRVYKQKRVQVFLKELGIATQKDFAND